MHRFFAYQTNVVIPCGLAFVLDLVRLNRGGGGNGGVSADADPAVREAVLQVMGHLADHQEEGRKK